MNIITIGKKIQEYRFVYFTYISPLHFPKSPK